MLLCARGINDDVWAWGVLRFPESQLSFSLGPTPELEALQFQPGRERGEESCSEQHFGSL